MDRPPRRRPSPAVLAGVPGAPAPPQQPTFRVETDLVNFGVTVTDRRGNFLTDLTAEDFEIFEDGKKQTLKYFARGDDTAAAPDLHVGLLFDTSGSMGEDIQLARSAAIRFLNTLDRRQGHHARRLRYRGPRLASYGQQDFPRLVERIRSREAGGLHGDVRRARRLPRRADVDDGRTILVLYTDGGDTRSTIGFGDVMTLVRASDVTIYAVGFLENQPSNVARSSSGSG